MSLRGKNCRASRACTAFLLLCSAASIFPADVERELEQLKERNRLLESQLAEQQKMIESLKESVDRLSDRSMSPGEAPAPSRGLFSQPFSMENIRLSGEAGVAFFSQPSKGAFPNEEFRVDEAKLFLDVKLWEDIYFFTELNLLERESPDHFLYLGELYVDFENVLRIWRDGLLNVRVGRFDTPFGEEYLVRDAIDNPLISHSLSDIWGVDEGLELYGAVDKVSYVVAVQNGGEPSLRDYDSDKAVIGRVGYTPTDWLYLSVSGMRTGDLNTEEDEFSALWFGNGFFKSIASSAETFSADLVEGDFALTFKRGHFKGAGGYVFARDSSASRNKRDIYYYYLEGLGRITPKFYGVTRFSQIFADNGYPLVGGGDFGEHMFGPSLTKELWRLSLGAGWHITDNILLKAEYAFDGGSLVNGASRNDENLFAAELAVRF